MMIHNWTSGASDTLGDIFVLMLFKCLLDDAHVT
jgi:hypothetical protein